MDKLKVRFKLNGLEFELEGNEDTVRSELGVFKDFVMNSLINKINLAQSTEDSKGLLVAGQLDVENGNIPLLKEVVMKDLPKTEGEWVLVYCFYASSFGKEPFKESDIRMLYESSKRKNESRMKNFSTNFSKVLASGFIRVLNSEEYITLQKGIEQAGKILGIQNVNLDQEASHTNNPANEGTNLANPKRRIPKAKPNPKSASFNIVSDLNLNPTGKKSLKSFYAEFITKAFFEKNTLFLYYLERVLNTDSIGIHHIYTCYKNVGEKVPGNLYQSLIDTKNTKGWIDFREISNIRVTVSGENFVEHDLAKSV